MKICITIDDVIRAKTRQIGKVYEKYIDSDINLDAIEFKTDDMSKEFNFPSTKEYFKFLYEDYPFEIFAEAPVMEKMLDKNLNLWHIDIENRDCDEDIELIIANPREFNASIGFTYFFLSQIATRIRNVFFPKDYSEIWDRCDVLITADVKLLDEKPEGKKSIKISAPYNKECKSDYTYDTLSDFLKDEEIIDKLIGNENDTSGE